MNQEQYLSDANKIRERIITQQNYNIEQKSQECADQLMSVDSIRSAMTDYLNVGNASFNTFNPNNAHFSRQYNPDPKAMRLFRNQGSANALFARATGQAMFNQAGGYNITDYTAMVDGVIWKIASTLDDKFSLTPSFPDKNLPAIDQIFVEWIEGTKGLALDYLYGDAVPEIRKLSRGAYSFSAPAVRMQKLFYEQDMLFTRMMGTGNFAERGLLQQISYDSLDSYVKMMSKKKKTISDYVFNGTYTFAPANGSTPITVSSGVPSGNTLLPIGAVWGTSSGGSYIPNSAANPVLDLQYWFSSASNLKRLLPMIKGLVMNPNTSLLFLNNQNTQNYVNRILANSTLMRNGDVYSTAKVAEVTIPSVRKFDITIDYTGYMPDVVTSGVPVDTTPLEYFIPDGYIFFELEVPVQYGSPVGDFVFLGQLQNGGYLNPNPGAWIVLEDNTVPGSRGGLGQPFLSLICGYAGAPRIRRPDDLMIAKVVA